MKSTQVILGLGSNLGDRADNLRRARELIRQEMPILKASRIYETKPWGYANQPNFLNQVLVTRTTMPPYALLDFVKAIEITLGRKPTFRYGPRVIDIDILAYGNLRLITPRLTIPHPRMAEREFVLIPLMEILPEWRHPETGLTAKEMLARLNSEGVKLYLPEREASRN